MPASFETFYEETFGALGGYALSLVGDRNLAEELAQEAMVRIYARWAVLREPRPYAYRTVTNLARDRWRRRQRELAAMPDLVDRPVDAPDVAVLDAVERLPAHLRSVVLLHYYADLPVAEVAQAIRRPVGTVKRRLLDARTALGRSLEGRDR